MEVPTAKCRLDALEIPGDQSFPVFLDTLKITQMKLITRQNMGTAKPTTADCIPRFFMSDHFSLPHLLAVSPRRRLRVIPGAVRIIEANA
jgi:hypothetical protein